MSSAMIEEGTETTETDVDSTDGHYVTSVLKTRFRE